MCVSCKINMIPVLPFQITYHSPTGNPLSQGTMPNQLAAASCTPPCTISQVPPHSKTIHLLSRELSFSYPSSAFSLLTFSSSSSLSLSLSALLSPFGSIHRKLDMKSDLQESLKDKAQFKLLFS